jgi:hypothetical protein
MLAVHTLKQLTGVGTHLISGLPLPGVLGLDPYRSGSCGCFGSLGACGGYSFGCRTVRDARPLTYTDRKADSVRCLRRAPGWHVVTQPARAHAGGLAGRRLHSPPCHRCPPW